MHFFLLLFAAVASPPFVGGRLLGEASQTAANNSHQARGAVQPTTPNETYESGLNYLRSGQTGKAIESLSTAVRREPKSKAARCGLGQAYINAGHLAEAVEQLRACAELDFNDPQAQFNLGQAYLRQALEVASKILEAENTSPYARRIFAENYEGKNDLPEAETQYRLALGEQPEAVDLRLALGRLHLRAGEADKAREDFKCALEVAPDSLAAHYILAEFDLSQGDFSGTLSQLQWVSAHNPEFLAGRPDYLDLPAQQTTRQAVCLELSEFVAANPRDLSLAALKHLCASSLDGQFISGPVQQPERHAWPAAAHDEEIGGSGLTSRQACDAGLCQICVERLRSPSQDFGQTINIRAEVAQCFYEIGDYESAYRQLAQPATSDSPSLGTLYWFQESSRRLSEISFERLAQLDPDSYLIHLLNAQSSEEQQRPEVAIREYKAALARRPEAVNLRVLLARLEWKWQEYDDALPELMEALRLDPTNPAANYLAGDIWVQKHNSEKALPYLRRAVTAGAGFINAEASLGRALAQLGQFEEAVKELESVAPADADGSIHYQLYRVYLKLGNSAKANTCLASFKRLSARHPPGTGPR